MYLIHTYSPECLLYVAILHPQIHVQTTKISIIHVLNLYVVYSARKDHPILKQNAIILS